MFQLISLTLCMKHFTGPHDAENLSFYLNYCIDKYGIGNKIYSICADNAGDIQNGIQLVKQNGNTHFTGRCMGHLLQLIVKKVIDSIKTISTGTKGLNFIFCIFNFGFIKLCVKNLRPK